MYKKPILEFIFFESEDIIMTSGNDDSDIEYE